MIGKLFATCLLACGLAGCIDEGIVGTRAAQGSAEGGVEAGTGRCEDDDPDDPFDIDDDDDCDVDELDGAAGDGDGDGDGDDDPSP